MINPIKENIYSDSKKNKAISVAYDFFWLGFIIYTVCYVIPGINFSLKYFQAVQLGAIVIFLCAGAYLVSLNIENVYLKLVFIAYVLWSLLTILRGFSSDYNFLKNILFNANFSVFLYFVPFVMVFKEGILNLRKLFSVIIILNLFFVLFVFIYRNILIYGIANFYRLPTGLTESLTHFLSLPAAFILLTYKYHKKRTIFFSAAILILTFVLVTIRARRGLMFMTLCFILSSYLIYSFTNKGSILKVLISVLVVAFIGLYSYMIYSKNKSGTFGLITNRMYEDTRNGVESYFYNDMTPKDLLIGRGINGLYYCPGIDETLGSVTVLRSVIETGYLQIVLKGGFFGLALYLLITIPAIFKGFFSSKNLLAKASSTWILLYTIFLYPTYVNMFSLTYILIWMSVGICYSKSLREKSDEDIMQLYQNYL